MSDKRDAPDVAAQDHPGDAVALFSDFVEEFDAYYRDRTEFDERLKLWCGLLDKYHTPGGVSLDMGCGTGVLSFYLASKPGRVVAIDGAPGMLKFCEEQRVARGIDNVRFVQGRLPAVELPDVTSADLIISSSVVEYVDDLDAALALFARLLKPQAALLVSLPNVFSVSRTYERVKYKLTGQPTIYEYIRHFTSPDQLQRRVRRLGLTLEEAHYFTHATRLARLTRGLHLPPVFTEDLFVAAFRKR
jgi:ubiquinone/menaquinone biosynthesis C-methylase UbiE